MYKKEMEGKLYFYKEKLLTKYKENVILKM